MERKDNTLPEGCLPFDDSCHLGPPITDIIYSEDGRLADFYDDGKPVTAYRQSNPRMIPGANGHFSILFKDLDDKRCYIFLNQEQSLRRLIDPKPDSR